MEERICQKLCIAPYYLPAQVLSSEWNTKRVRQDASGNSEDDEDDELPCAICQRFWSYDLMALYRSVSMCNMPALLKLRPYGAIQICLLLFFRPTSTIIIIIIGESERHCIWRGLWRSVRNLFHGQDAAYRKERLVIFKEDRVGGRATVTTDEERVLW